MSDCQRSDGKIGMSGSLRGRRSEEMTQSMLSPYGSRKYLLSLRGGEGN